jgi:hypothetical protein
MTQTTRAVIGFLAAPAVPSALLYVGGIFRGFGDAAFVFPFIVLLLGYVAIVVIGIPVHLLLRRKHIRSLSAYGLSGMLIGPAFYLLFEALTAYPGQLIEVLSRAYGAVLFAMIYSATAAVVFWAIAIRGAARDPATGRV